MKTHILQTITTTIHGISRMAFVAMLLIGAAALQSCDDDNGTFPTYPLNLPNAIVTLKTADNGTFYMQLDDSTRIKAANIPQNPYGGKEVRAFINYRLLTNPGNNRQYTVYINWVDSILTKPMAQAQSPDGVPADYGNDAVEILRDWTVAEDGYLTIHFRTQWAASGTPHIVNLVQTSAGNPYDLTFHHNAQGVKGGYWGDGIVAFRLDKLPDTGGKEMDLTLRWKSFSGDKSVTFKYSTRGSNNTIEGLSYAASGQFEKAIK